MAQIGKEHWRLPGPICQLQQGHLGQDRRGNAQVSLNISKCGDFSLSRQHVLVQGCFQWCPVRGQEAIDTNLNMKKCTVGKARRLCSSCGNWTGSALESTYEEKMVRPQKQLELVWKEGKLTATFKICWSNQGKNDDLLYMTCCWIMLPDELIKP